MVTYTYTYIYIYGERQTERERERERPTHRGRYRIMENQMQRKTGNYMEDGGLRVGREKPKLSSN